MSEKALQRLREHLGDGVLATSSDHGDDTAVLTRDVLVEAARFLRDQPDLRFDLPTDLTAVDWPGRDPRFDLVIHLYSTVHHHRVRLKVGVAEDDPTVPSLTGVYSGLGWYEREAWDMYGLRFLGHPDLRRIFLQEEFVGHPLRKDYPKEKRQPLCRREAGT
jgi:NADH-quinone oxidoreductase subunit C